MINLFKVFMTDAARAHADLVLQSGYIGQGPRVDEFEAALSRIMDGAPILTTNSCTSALDLALHCCEVGPGDHVVTTPQTCTATNGVIVRRGAHPIWADIDPTTGNIDPDDVARKLTPQTKAIMAVDWGGRACDYDALRSHGIPVIEDAAHAFATTYQGEHVAKANGSDYACFSFQAIKHLTTGDGGAISAPADQIERLRNLRWYGLDRTSKKSFRCEQNITEVGYKYHMNDIAAAIGIGNLGGMENLVARHVAHAKQLCMDLQGIAGVKIPKFDVESSWWIYSIMVNDPKDFMAKMAERGIECSPVHARNDTHTAFIEASVNPSDDLPGVTEWTAHHVAIPVGWWLSDEDLQAVIIATSECA